MNKLLLAASLGTAALAAHAQNISAQALKGDALVVSGTIDVYAQRATGSTASRYLVTSGGNATSKLLVRANEDLGGGMNAGIWLEAGLAIDTGLGNATNTNNQPSGAVAAGGLMWNRRSIVYLNGDWGEVHLGRDWSPTYDAFTARFDVFGVGSGIGVNYISSINPNQVRISNDVAYITPRFAGFAANVQHWFGENASGTATAKDGGGDGIRIHYDNGPLGAVLALARTNFAAGNALYRDAAFVYDFGSFKLTGNVNHDQQAALKQEGLLIGASVPAGLWEFKGTYSQLKTNAPNSPTAQKYALGLVYNLSKRTAAYATVAQINNRNGSALAIAGATTAANERSRGFDLGVRHNF